MYEKMFSALEGGECLNGTAQGGKKKEETFNSTNVSFGKEIQQMQKQFQDEMQSRIFELESLLQEKDSLLS